MKKHLLDVMFASEKRKKVLLLLQDGPKEMGDILTALDTTRQSLLPQVRILEEHHLVHHKRDTYTLTPMGQLVIDEIAPAIGTADVFSDNNDYWGTHDFYFIPPHLLKRIREIGLCKSVDVQLSELFDEDRTFFEEAQKTKSLLTITSFALSHFKQLYSELATSGVEISIIISSELYEKLVSDYTEDLKHILQNPKIKLFKYPTKFGFLSFTHTDHVIMLRLLTLKGNYDNKRIICSGENALKWGNELFEFYLKCSIQVTDI